MPEQTIPEQKPSFIYSVIKGVGGFVKGALAGGTVGAVGGGLLGTIAMLAEMVFAWQPGFVLAFGVIKMGAIIGAAAFGAIGALSGAMTDIVRSRETAQLSAEDVVAVAKISYAQGLANGLNQQQQIDEQTNKWRDDEKKRAEARAGTISEILH